MADNYRIRILIAEDNDLLREAFIIFFKEQLHIEVVGQAADTGQTLYLCKQIQPDILLIHARLRPMYIPDLIQLLCKQVPDMRIVVLSSTEEAVTAEALFEAGAAEVVVKGILASNLLAIIHQVYFKS